MKKLILTILALAVAGGAWAQDFEHIGTHERAAMKANEAETREYARARNLTTTGTVTPVDSVWFLAKHAEHDSLEYTLNAKVLAAMAHSEPPFDYVFLDQLRMIAQDIMKREKIFGKLHSEAMVIYERLGDEEKRSEMGESIRRALLPLPEVMPGDTLPDATLPDLDSVTHNLSDYRGKFLLLDVWSSTCAPCIASFPELGKLQQANRDLLSVVGLCWDNERNWRAVSARQPFPATNLHLPDSHELTEMFRLYVIPHNILVSPEGKVLAVWKGTLIHNMHEELRKFIPDIK